MLPLNVTAEPPVTSAGEPVRLAPNRSNLDDILESCKEGMLVAPWVVAQD
jgi:hypothetical protein